LSALAILMHVQNSVASALRQGRKTKTNK